MLHGDRTEAATGPLLRANRLKATSVCTKRCVRMLVVALDVVVERAGRTPFLAEHPHERSRHLRRGRTRWSLIQCQPGINGLQHGFLMGRSAPTPHADIAHARTQCCPACGRGGAVCCLACCRIVSRFANARDCAVSKSLAISRRAARSVGLRSLGCIRPCERGTRS